MNKEILEKIKNDPDYIKLVTTRKKFAWGLTFVLLLIYYSFILTIAFDPKLLGTPISKDSIITIGIPIGIFIIFAAFILTGISLFAAGAIEGEVQRQPLNISAIIMFLVFVSATLGITYWAAKKQELQKIFILQEVELQLFKMDLH